MTDVLTDGKYFSFLATVDEEGKPHLRPLFALIVDKKIYFSTTDGSRKAKEISMNPNCEIILPFAKSDVLTYIKISGEAFRIFQEGIKNGILNSTSYSIEQYIDIKNNEIIVYEIIPTSVEQFVSYKKPIEDITDRFLNRR